MKGNIMGGPKYSAALWVATEDEWREKCEHLQINDEVDRVDWVVLDPNISYSELNKFMDSMYFSDMFSDTICNMIVLGNNYHDLYPLFAQIGYDGSIRYA